MSRGRPKHFDPPVNWRLSMPTSVVTQLELLLLDPVTGRPAVGSRSALMTQLIRVLLQAAATGNPMQDLSNALRVLPASKENSP